MEKRELISKLENIINSPNLSADLYFVFKKGEYYVQYLSDPDQSLRDELISQFISVLDVYTQESNNYELIDIYDDNEHEDYNLFYDDIENNEIADAIFNFDRANVLPYTSDIGSFSQIYGFLIEISNGTDSLTIYKRNQPTNAINPSKAINFISGTGNKLSLINRNTIYMYKSVDLFKIDNTILINSRAVYETQFGFIAELKRKAETGFIDLTAIEIFNFEEELQDKIKKFPKGELKKLCNLTKNNPIIEQKNWKAVLRQGKSYAGYKFEKNDDGTIKIKTQKELKILISILNRDFNMNDASREKFITKNKKLINNASR